MKQIVVILILAVLAMSACTKDNTVPEDPDGHIINPPPPAKEVVFTLSVENLSPFEGCCTDVQIFLGDSIFPFLNLNNVHVEDMEKKITGTEAENISGKTCRVEVTATLAIEGLAIDGKPDPDNFAIIPTIGDTVKLAIKVTE